MKNLIICTVLLLLPCLIFAQTRTVKKMKRKYKIENAETFSILVPGCVIRTVMGLSGEKETKKMLKGVRHLRLVVIDNNETNIKQKDLNKVWRKMDKIGFESLMEIRDGNEHIEFTIKERRSKIRKAVIMITSDTEMVMIQFKGRIDIKKMKQLIDKYKERENDDDPLEDLIRA